MLLVFGFASIKEVPFLSFSVFYIDRYVVVKACENLSVYIHIVMAKCKCSINDSIKSEYPFIKCVNENVKCTLCNLKFCIAHGILFLLLNVYGSTIFSLCTRQMWVVSCLPLPLYPGERVHSTHWRWGLVGPRSCLEALEKRNSLSSVGNEPKFLGVNPVVHHYIDWALSAPFINVILIYCHVFLVTWLIIMG
jgi:hypothetical protein